MTTIEKLGKEFKKRRQANCITQKYLANEAGLSTATYVNIEKGKANPRLNTLVSIENALITLTESNIKKINDGE